MRKKTNSNKYSVTLSAQLKWHLINNVLFYAVCGIFVQNTNELKDDRTGKNDFPSNLQ